MDLEFESQYSKYIWLVAYINRDHLAICDRQLSKSPLYKGIKAFIPTVSILKKQVKGRQEFEEVPLLFNYGFFRIQRSKVNAEFLAKLKDDVQAIHSWVRDPMITYSEKPTLNIENKTVKRDHSLSIGVASDDEICQMITQRAKLSIYDSEELAKVKAGETIMLRGYPFEGLPAKVLSINHKSQKIRCQLDFKDTIKDVTLSFESVFWSIYEGSYDIENIKREESLEELGLKSKTGVDRILKNSFRDVD